MPNNRMGLTVLESLVVILICIALLWVAVPILMIRMGWKDAGAMVVKEGDKAPQFEGAPMVLKPRVGEIETPKLVVPTQKDLQSPPNIPYGGKPLE